MEPPNGTLLDHHHLLDWCSRAGLGSDWVCSLERRRPFIFRGGEGNLVDGQERLKYRIADDCMSRRSNGANLSFPLEFGIGEGENYASPNQVRDR
jgi:hypothetical protein